MFIFEGIPGTSLKYLMLYNNKADPTHIYTRFFPKLFIYLRTWVNHCGACSTISV